MSTLLNMSRLKMQVLTSGVGGLMLGIAMLHLMPHAIESLGSASRAGALALAGLVPMFLLIRFFHAHEHVDPEAVAHLDGEKEDHNESSICEHTHDHARVGMSWTGLFFGLMIHTLVDGVALASSVITECEYGAWLGLGGLGTFLAVFLHKPLDAFAITSVMHRQRWSISSQVRVTLIYSLACPLGAMAMYFGVSRFITHPDALGWGLALSSGFFIAIALGDLLPEVQFNDHNRGKMTTALLVGVAIAVMVENLPGHDHSLHSKPATTNGSQDSESHHDDHEGHDH